MTETYELPPKTISVEYVRYTLDKLYPKSLRRHSLIIEAAKEMVRNNHLWVIPFIIVWKPDSLDSNLKNFLSRMFSPQDPTALWPVHKFGLLQNITLAIQLLSELEIPTIES